MHSDVWCRMEEAKNRKFCTDRGMSMVLARVRVFPVRSQQQKALSVFFTSDWEEAIPHTYPAHTEVASVSSSLGWAFIGYRERR